MTNYSDKSMLDTPAGIVRVLLGLVFFLAGILKLVVPSLGDAFAGQLAAANIPLQSLVLYTFPFVEMALGILLVIGFHTRFVAAAAAVSMIVATYVHIVADDPALFPLQPVEPVGPLVLLLMLLYFIVRGAGAWSIERKES